MFCSNCGAVLDENAKYCGVCGCKVVEETEQTEKSSQECDSSSKKTKDRAGLVVICVFFALIVIIIIVFFMKFLHSEMRSYNREYPRKENTTIYDSEELESYLKENGLIDE